MSKLYLLAIPAVLALTVGVYQAIPGRAPTLPTMSFSLTGTLKAAPEVKETRTSPVAQWPGEARQWPEVIAREEAVLARSELKPDDAYYANYQLLLAHHATGNMAGERKALQGMIDSGFLTTDQQAALVRALVAMKSQGTGD